MRELGGLKCPCMWILFGVVAHFSYSAAIKEASKEQHKAHNVFIVRLKGPPVSAYEGHLEGFAATASKNGERLDASRKEAQEYTDYLRQSHTGILESVMEPGSYEKLYSYTVVLNAFSVKMYHASYQAQYLEAHPSVISIEPDILFQKTTTHTPDFLGLPNGVWALAGGPEYAGEGVVIGMLDTGIDPKHPSFIRENWNRPYNPLERWRGQCFVSETFPSGSCNGKIIGAQHFAKGIIAANLFNSTYDFASPLDGDGHGTHTSSVAAGSSNIPVVVKGFNYGRASGIAPRARLAIYKVVFRDGGFLSDVLAGIDQATMDGVDALSISLGSISTAPGIPCLNIFDVALLFAARAGVSVVHAGGNNGPYPLTMNSYGPWIISVAAGLNDRTYPNPIALRDGEVLTGNGLSAGSPSRLWHPLIYAEDAFTDATSSLDYEYFSYCQDPAPFNATMVKNKVLICNYIEYATSDSLNQFENSIATALNMSAAGLIIVSKPSDLTTKEKPVILDPFPFPLPGAFISDINTSNCLLQFYFSRAKRDDSGKVIDFGARVRLEDSRQAAYSTEAPQVTYFSSRGPVYANTVNMEMADLLKPDLVAPGNQIWGAWTPAGIDVPGYHGQSFAMLSGTSMAAPHVAGIVALIKQEHPEWSPSAIHSALLTTANSLDTWQFPILAQQPSQTTSIGTLVGPASPFDVGSGAVNATAALNPGLIFERDFQDYVDFLCTLPGVDSNTVEDSTGAACRTVPGGRPSDLNIPSITVSNLIGQRLLNRTVTSYESENETYTAMIYPPAGVDVKVEPGTFTLGLHERVPLIITVRAIASNRAFTFGSIVLKGSNGHSVLIPLSISADLEVRI